MKIEEVLTSGPGSDEDIFMITATRKELTELADVVGVLSEIRLSSGTAGKFYAWLARLTPDVKEK